MNKDNENVFLPKFEKEHLSIKIKTDPGRKYFNETNDIQNSIANRANSLLFRWKSISNEYPPSLTGLCDGINSEHDDGKHADEMRNLFIMPSFDELDELALDENGKIKKLSKEQLKDIQKNGEFNVPSANFPGQVHKWRLTNWLQLGYVRSNEIFYRNLSDSLEFLIVGSKRFLFSYSSVISVVSGFRSIRYGITRLLDMLIGLPATYKTGIAEAITEAETKFLVADLIVDPVEQHKFQTFCQLFRKKMNKEIDDKKLVFDVPVFYLTPDGISIDLRLLDKKLMKKANAILSKLLSDSEEDKDWFDSRKMELVAKFKGEGLSNEQIIEEINKILKIEHQERIFKKISQNVKEFDKLSPNIATRLVDQARATMVMNDAVRKVQNEIDSHMTKYEADLKVQNPVRSKINEWLHDRLRVERERFAKLNTYREYTLAIDECDKQNLRQAAYFLKREFVFRTEHEDQVRKEAKLNQKTLPMKVFTFNRAIWQPKNWIVTKIEEGKPDEVVPNVFYPSTRSSNPRINYSLTRSITYTSSTMYPFWRWKNFFLRTWVYFQNFLFYFGLVIPFFSPVSFAVIYKLGYFYPAKTMDPRTGIIHVENNSKTRTLFTRIKAVWNNVAQSRQKFEQIPDRGLIGKSTQRIFNRIWNYIFKGLIGTIGLSIMVPAVCLSLSTASLILAITMPIWYPIVSILTHLAFGLVYDFDYPYNGSAINRSIVFFRAFVWHILFSGVLQSAFSVVAAFVLCPAASILIAIYACIRKVTRSIWDAFMFHVVLKPRARIPSSDTFVARRISGPGLASQFLYQISTEQALAALEISLEMSILDAYLICIQKMIDEPSVAYREFFDALLEPFSSTSSFRVNTSYDQIIRDNEKYVESFRKCISKRRQHLQDSLYKAESAHPQMNRLSRKAYVNLLGNNHSLTSIRLTNRDLNIVIQKGSEIVKAQYLKYIVPYHDKNIKDIFREVNVDLNDWTGLTGVRLERLFGTGILTSLDESDTVFKLEIDHLNLRKYTKMIEKSELRDDLELAMIQYNPKSKRLVIQRPAVDRSLFNAVNDSLASEIRSRTYSQMIIPPRIPVYNGITSLLIFNRDNKDNQIKFSSLSQLKNLL